MKRFIPVTAASALLVAACVFVIAAAPVQDESKQDKLIKGLTDRIEKLEKRVADLEKKLAEQAASAKRGDGLKGWFDKFGGKLGEGKDAFKDLFDEFRRSMPELPEPGTLPDFFQGLDLEQLLETFKGQFGGQFDGQFPDFFDGLDMDGLFERFKDKLEKKPEPKRSTPRSREV